MFQERLLTVVLNYRTAELTMAAVDAARREMQDIDGEIVVVDNNSGDGSFEKLQTEAARLGWLEGGRVRVFQSGRNGGFGAGNNFGAGIGLSNGARPDFVYILNSDAQPGPGAIATLLDFMRDNPKTGLAGSYIHGPHGEWHCTCFRFPTISSEFEGAARIGAISRLLSHKAVPVSLDDARERVDWLAGASLMLRQDMLDEIGGFDEEFFLYFEDTELSHRAVKAGWVTSYVSDSKVAHIGSVSTQAKSWQRVPVYWFDSRWNYFRKTNGVGYAALATAARVFGTLIWRIKRLLSGHPRVDPPNFLRDLIFHAIGLSIGRSSKPNTEPVTVEVK